MLEPLDPEALRRATLRAALTVSRPGNRIGLSDAIAAEAEREGLEGLSALSTINALRRQHPGLGIGPDPAVTARWVALWLRVDTTGPVGRLDDGTKRRLREI